MNVRVTGLGLLLIACSSKSSEPPKPAPVAKEKDKAKEKEALPTRETLAFEVTEGEIQNLFFRRGPVAAHVLASSGLTPRLIVAFPAGNTGVGVWFEKVAAPVKFTVQAPLTPVERKDGMRGVVALVTTDTKELVIRGAVLGSIRTLRDYNQLGKAPPETKHEVSAGPPVVLRRTTADGKHHVELTLEPKERTAIAVQGDKITITAPDTIRLQATALADDEPLTPIPMGSLVTTAKPEERDLRALAFLSYEQKLLAGSWRFLTYFGRDTLLSVRLMLPVLQPDIVEAALGAVLQRLAPDGDVAHEEDIGDFAALRNSKETKPPPADLRQPIYDYKMIDDDFILAPVLAAYFLDGAGASRAADFMARKVSAEQTFGQAVEKNLELVIKRATPFADKPAATNLIALKPNIPVGQWRDSNEGLGNGRYAFDVNVALVPAALDAAARLYESPLLNKPDAAANARRLAKAWQSAESYFRVTVPAATATARVKQYAAGLGLDAAPALASIKQPITYSALSLDAKGKPIEVMHTDDGFVLLFTSPSPAYLDQVAAELTRPFPAGLRTPVGMVVANPAFAADAKVRAMFTPGHYHGTVVWSWQQAMLAAGLARQLARTDLPPATKTALETAQRSLWDVIDATSKQRSGELWTWDVKDHQIVFAPFGQGHGHADESNAVQLWSTVYLGVHRP